MMPTHTSATLIVRDHDELRILLELLHQHVEPLVVGFVEGGIGLGQSCAVECRVQGSSETIYKMCCEHGPIFDAKEVVFGR
ncbi:MAG: iron-sulfur cluster-binding protein [Planctomycetota bacterium]